MKIAISLLIVAGLMTGCASVKTPTATGGSKSDGIVKMSYSYGMFEQPQVEWATALSSAKKRCNSWGYGSAEKFGGSTTECNRYSNGSCNHWFVTTEYQCLD